MRNTAILFLKTAILICFGLVILTLTSCKENGVSKKQLRNIEDYITENNLTVTSKTDDGLHYIKLNDGDGTAVSFGDNINVNYKGNLLNGEVFDSGNFTFTLGGGRVIPGFDLGISQMEVGEKAILIFPSTLGYGSSGQGSIPANSPLVFEIEVVEVQ